jgi:hypothetical protein
MIKTIVTSKSIKHTKYITLVSWKSFMEKKVFNLAILYVVIEDVPHSSMKFYKVSKFISIRTGLKALEAYIYKTL